MRDELENPMVLGDYYESAPEAGYPEKLGWVLDKGLGYKAAAVGLHVDWYAIDGLRDQLEAAFELFLESKPDDVQEWEEELLELDPYHDEFSEWWREKRALARRISA